ncbi:hypothetical protein RHMOL_Rhmol04G0155400 [Rhododendron molle]|uniref:Uncharacterized protein n=1 Tax=Rhododendron molle TaxID=49168 RepID=A0ACC0P154_RHOML|nr:hypothetical protein RHMOL_Rhmol04G0155400 [Rhododendron molle]
MTLTPCSKLQRRYVIWLVCITNWLCIVGTCFTDKNENVTQISCDNVLSSYLSQAY